MNENEVTPEKRLETMEKSKTAVESYKKIIQDSQSKKIIQDSPSKKIGQIRDKSEETMKKNENINVFESFKLDQYIADNSNLRMTSVLASQNPKIGTNPEKHPIAIFCVGQTSVVPQRSLFNKGLMSLWSTFVSFLLLLVIVFELPGVSFPEFLVGTFSMILPILVCFSGLVPIFGF
jgi:hypothetical protein